MNTTTLQSCINSPGVKLYILDAVMNATNNVTNIPCPVCSSNPSGYMIAVFVFTLTIIVTQVSVYLIAFIKNQYDKHLKGIQYKVNGSTTEPI